jgi:hypothetical protein
MSTSRSRCCFCRQWSWSAPRRTRSAFASEEAIDAIIGVQHDKGAAAVAASEIRATADVGRTRLNLVKEEPARFGPYITAAFDDAELERALELDPLLEAPVAVCGCGRAPTQRSPLDPEFRPV